MMSSLRLTIVMMFLVAGQCVLAAPPKPVFEDEDESPIFTDDELRSIVRAPRPIFADEPYFEDFEEDVYPSELDEPILPVECLRDSVQVDHELQPWWSVLRPLKAIRDFHTDKSDDWPWPDRGRSWTARMTAVRWSRSGVEGGTLFSNPAVGSQSVSGSGFDVGHDGADLSLIVHDFWPNGVEEYDLEARFVYLLQATSNQSAAFTGPTTQLHAFPTITEMQALNLASSLTADFYTGELNVRHESENGWWTSIWGLRYVSMDDDLNATFTDPMSLATVSRYRSQTSNSMIGPQVGGNLTFLRTRRFCVDARGKVGACWNHVEVSSNYTGTNAFTISESKNQASFLGEFGIDGRYAFGRQWTFVLGYQALLVTRIADSTNQLNHANSSTGTGYDSDSSVLYHAGSFGFEYRY